MTTEQAPIVIVGGGAGGLELACKLGRQLGPQRVTLIDAALFHIWKPSLHEVAAGTLDIHQEGLSYQMLAHDNRFAFVYGPLIALDQAAKEVIVDAIADDQGQPVLPQRRVAYSSLVLALGSTANHFNVPGAAQHSMSLNTPQDAEQFRLRMLKLLALADLRKPTEPDAGLDIVIIGGGATGVELAAELREASAVHTTYGLRRIDPNRDVRITLLEGAGRILPPLPEKVALAATTLLSQRHVRVVTNCRVQAVEPRQVRDAAGNTYPADLCVWAAGIQAPAVLSTLGLPVERGGLLRVDAQLRVHGCSDIYALGDCAACPMVDATGRALGVPATGASVAGAPAPGAAAAPPAPARLVPPRAQAAHQQASFLCRALLRAHRGQPAESRSYVYQDHGSLVSLGTRSSVGSLMGNLFLASSWFVEGLFARSMYVSLHLLHHQAVLGTLRTGVLALARFLVKRATPLVKLH